MSTSSKIRKILSAIAAVLTLSTLLGSLASCDSKDKTPAGNSVSTTAAPATTAAPETEEEEDDDENATAAPQVTGVSYANGDHICIYGTAEPNATVYCTGGKEDLVFQCDEGGIYMFDLPAGKTKGIKVYAQVEGKEESRKRSVTISGSLSTHDKQVILGKNGHLHLNTTMWDYLHANTWNNGQMQQRRERYEKILADIQTVSPGTKLIYFIAPNQCTVYPEAMPDYLAEQVQNRPSKLEAFVEFMADSEVLYITPAQYLIERKDQGMLYQKTDTHWNELGAYYGVEYLLSFIAKDFPDVTKQLSLDDCTISKRYIDGGDMLNYLQLNLDKNQEYSTFCRVNNPTSDLNYDKPYRMNFENIWTSDAHVSTKKSSDKLPTALMYRDSFSTNMMIFMSECFSRIDYTAFIGHNVSISTVRNVKPDYVIVECVERNMDGIM